MRSREAVRAIMADEGIGTKALSDRMGKSMRLVCDRLSQDNMSVEKLTEMLRVMGYKVVVMPADRRLRDHEYAIE